MRIVILDSADEVAAYGAEIFIRCIRQKPAAVLGLATGSTPLALYRRLIDANRDAVVSFAKVSSFNLDEYLGLAGDHPQSYRHFMNTHLFDHIDINPDNTHVPPGDAADPLQACADYDKLITKLGGIDIQLLGIGRNGHIGFNEPSSGLQSRTRVKTLTRATIDDNARFFSTQEFQPHLSITMGIGTILEARKVVLLATGAAKAGAIKAAAEGPLTASCPASALQMHPDALLIVDAAAAAGLERKAFYKHIERENQKLLQSLGKT
ncbi:glucosamine-6-phosphate deaminase [Exilibacterium tricleocarpae]|uniref:Glucosamine-6-phosphate deaminase n=2 Tax=Exilibacterium tricleocarpae TaxID=2591008 RepID=A0A545TP55_9GAMM|nr:glucosamine-6-phosphate deaminase [Exilibacterium tricleocarpae]